MAMPLPTGYDLVSWFDEDGDGSLSAGEVLTGLLYEYAFFEL